MFRLQKLLEAAGKPPGYAAVYQAFQDMASSDKLQCASKTSKIKNPDQVSKLCRLVDLARPANVLPEMQRMQLHNGNITWCGKWTIVTRMLGTTESDEQLAFVVRLTDFVSQKVAMLSASRWPFGRLSRASPPSLERYRP